jgi:glycosyltransferase involved in cell wall biosynthesis
MIFPLQVIQLRMQLGRRVRIIVQNHAEKPGLRLRKFLQRLADPSIDAYLFTAKEMGEEWLRQGIIHRPGKIREVMEASSSFFPMDQHQARIHTGVSGNPVFLWVGRLDRNKDPLVVVGAFLKFSATQPSARLYMIYHTAELLPALNDLLDRWPGARDRVMLVGEKPHAEMSDWYNAADFIISGSHYEGSGIAVCEAMSCGCIPILTDILSFRKMTGDGDCGLLYAAGSGESLLAALNRIAGLDRTAQREKVLRQFRSGLSFEAIAAAIQRIAESL